MSLRTEVGQAVTEAQQDSWEKLRELVERDPRVVRYLLGLSYHSDPDRRKVGVEGLVLACRHHPRVIQEALKRLIWAMNDESGTNALTAPDVFRAIAEENATLLIPMIPDMTRLASDPGLREGLVASLQQVAVACPGAIGERLTRSLNRRFK